MGRDEACPGATGASGADHARPTARASGAEFFDDILSGKLPGIPIGNLVGFVPVAFERGPRGVPGHAGAGALQSAWHRTWRLRGHVARFLRGVCRTQHAPGRQGLDTTLELKANYVRPLIQQHRPRARGRATS